MADTHADTDDIEQIIGEIEELQQEMTSLDTKQAGAQPKKPVKLKSIAPVEDTPHIDEVEEELKQFRPEDTNSSLEDTLGDLKDPSQHETLVARAGDVMNETDYEDIDSLNTEGSLSMTLTGNMTLKLKYEIEGQEVTIGFSDHALRVQLMDGTEFKIPVRRKYLKKAS